MFPSPQRPHFGVFVQEQVEALRQLPDGPEVEVFALHSLGGGSVAHYGGSTLTLGRKLRELRPDVIHVHYGLSALPVLLQWPAIRRLGIRTVVTFHGTDMLGGRRAVQSVSRLAARMCDRAIGVSEPIVRQLRRLNRNVDYLPCGVSDIFLQPCQHPPARRPIVVFPAAPGRPEKDYPRFRRIIQQVDRLVGLPTETRCVDGLSRHQVRDLLDEACCLLMASQHEGSPQVVKEAVCRDLPVVSTDVGDVRKITVPFPGCTVSDDDAVLAEAVAARVQTPQLPDGARARDKEEFRNEPVAERLLQIYRGLYPASFRAPRLLRRTDGTRLRGEAS
jgi:glycosyltransferase involved in cell wall biosynthesis